MYASKVTRNILEQAAIEIGVKAEIDTLNSKETRHRVKLYPLVPNSAWQIAKNYPRICPRCRQKTKVIEMPKKVSSLLFLPNQGQLRGECGCEAMPAEWARYRRWKNERGDAPYQRISASIFYQGRRVHAICWHGFRDYFRAVFVKSPDAVFRTALATYSGAEAFEEKYRETGYRNIGSQMYPVCAAEACRCGEEGSIC